MEIDDGQTTPYPSARRIHEGGGFQPMHIGQRRLMQRLYGAIESVLLSH